MVIDSAAVARRLRDTLWFSTAAARAIIDAKAPGSNVPIYPDGSKGRSRGCVRYTSRPSTTPRPTYWRDRRAASAG